MKVYADKEGWEYNLINLDTNEIIKYALFADDEKGIWIEYQVDENGHFIKRGGEYGIPILFRRKGNIRLEKID